MKKYIKYFIAALFMLLCSLLLILLSNKTSNNNKQANDNNKISETNFYFDTFITITIYKDNSNIDYSSLITKCFEMCKNYELTFSTTLNNSELYLLNNNQNDVLLLSKDLSELLNNCLYFENLTKNAFNSKLGELCSLWNFKTSTIPLEAQISKALSKINSYNYEINGNTLCWTKTDSNVKEHPLIDVGGIAKGYIADKLKSFLVENGVTSATLNLGGNVLLIGSKLDNSNFNIGIKYPFLENEYIAFVEASDYSVVTSGIYERYFINDGVIYHHLLDSSTGYPIQNDLLSVTIISKESMIADALSTSVFVLGMDKGLELLNSIPDVYGVFINSDNKIILSDGLSIKSSGKILIN